jgi:hypothetical protein
MKFFSVACKKVEIIDGRPAFYWDVPPNRLGVFWCAECSADARPAGDLTHLAGHMPHPKGSCRPLKYNWNCFFCRRAPFLFDAASSMV